eukprot:360117-Chlamydomonas_euryale.AAC.10
MPSACKCQTKTHQNLDSALTLSSAQTFMRYTVGLGILSVGRCLPTTWYWCHLKLPCKDADKQHRRQPPMSHHDVKNHKYLNAAFLTCTILVFAGKEGRRPRQRRYCGQTRCGGSVRSHV